MAYVKQMERSHTTQFPRLLNRYFNWFPAMLLIVAALLKSHQLSTSPYVENLAFQSKPFTMALIIFEISLALLLIFEFRVKLFRPLAILTFITFLVFSATKGVSGEHSCGCFGVVEIAPWITTLIDVSALVLLWRWKAQEKGSFPKLLPVMILLLCSAAIYPVLTFRTNTLSDVGEVAGDGSLVVLETEEWTNKPLPIASLILGEQQFMQGTWRMVLYHEDCPVCQRLIQDSENGIDDLPTVYVEVPPYKSPNRISGSELLWRKLSDDHEWFVAAPNALLLQDGIVDVVEGQLR